MAIFAGWSVIGLLLCVALIIDSLLAGGPRASFGVVALTVVGAVPVVVAAAFATMEGKRPGHSQYAEMRELLRRLSRPARAGLVVVAVCVAFLFVSSWVLDRNGTGVKTGTGYATEARGGERTPVSKQEYLRDRGAEQRLFLAAGVWFYAWGGATCRGAKLRDDEEDQNDA
jgi:hypothetical protein